MGGELVAESPSGISGHLGTKVSFTILTYSSNKPTKVISFDTITSYEKIKTMVITGNQNRDEEVLGALHKLGLAISITTFQKSTVNQIKANLNYPEDRYNFVIIFDDEEFDGFEAARVLSENNLVSNFIFLMISKNDKKGNYLKCITLGIDHYLVKPFDISELISIIKDSFPKLENASLSVDIARERNEIKILVVEDNKMNQKVVGTMLRTLGYSFDLANDGYSGYLLTKSNKYDLILMDLIMPEMDGFEASQKILEIDKSILIVAFTADNMPETKRKAELSGIKDFISKPVKIEDLKKLFARYF
jgi:CheY-like chemotaxis protein